MAERIPCQREGIISSGWKSKSYDSSIKSKQLKNTFILFMAVHSGNRLNRADRRTVPMSASVVVSSEASDLHGYGVAPTELAELITGNK